MFAYLWYRISHVSDRYHPNGSLLVIATCLADARSLVLESIGTQCEALRIEPTRTWTVPEDSSRELFVFPDAGCG
jgi:hypothetical protein